MAISIQHARAIRQHAELLCPAEQVQAALHRVARQINAALAEAHPLVLSVMGGAVEDVPSARGGLVLGDFPSFTPSSTRRNAPGAISSARRASSAGKSPIGLQVTAPVRSEALLKGIGSSNVRGHLPRYSNVMVSFMEFSVSG